MFVASFIGSPAMSLIPLEASTVDGRTVLTSAEGWTLALSPTRTRARSQNATTQEGRARRAPLDDQAAQSRRSPARVPAKVYTVEPTGDVTFVQVFLSGAIVNISVPPTVDVAPDEQVWLEFDQERMHLFDGETEMALQGD